MSSNNAIPSSSSTSSSGPVVDLSAKTVTIQHKGRTYTLSNIKVGGKPIEELGITDNDKIKEILENVGKMTKTVYEEIDKGSNKPDLTKKHTISVIGEKATLKEESQGKQMAEVSDIRFGEMIAAINKLAAQTLPDALDHKHTKETSEKPVPSTTTQTENREQVDKEPESEKLEEESDVLNALQNMTTSFEADITASRDQVEDQEDVIQEYNKGIESEDELLGKGLEEELDFEVALEEDNEKQASVSESQSSMSSHLSEALQKFVKPGDRPGLKKYNTEISNKVFQAMMKMEINDETMSPQDKKAVLEPLKLRPSEQTRKEYLLAGKLYQENIFFDYDKTDPKLVNKTGRVLCKEIVTGLLTQDSKKLREVGKMISTIRTDSNLWVELTSKPEFKDILLSFTANVPGGTVNAGTIMRDDMSRLLSGKSLDEQAFLSDIGDNFKTLGKPILASDVVTKLQAAQQRANFYEQGGAEMTLPDGKKQHETVAMALERWSGNKAPTRARADNTLREEEIEEINRLLRAATGSEGNPIQI